MTTAMSRARSRPMESGSRLNVQSLIPLLIFWATLPGASSADTYPLNPGIDVTHYSFQLTLSDESDEIRGEATIGVLLESDDPSPIDFDLVGSDDSRERGMNVVDVTIDGAPARWAHENDRLRVEVGNGVSKGQHQSIKVSYRGIPADGLIISTNKHGERTFFGDNWPDRARHWLPTIDHPSDKAICEFTVIAPSHYQVVANGELVEESDLPGSKRLTHWKSTVPLPTKVMVIGVARFAVQHLGEWEGTPIESWVYPQDRDAGFHDFARAVRIVRFFTGHLGPFPYSKLANVQSTTRYGGMENASAIFYSENSINGAGENEGLLAHEIAHQWFGDSVTEGDWHHVWLSEGFATYLTQLYFEHVHGHDAFLSRMRGVRESYLERNPHTPIIDESIDDPTKLLNANSYQKGALVLHMLRRLVGEEAFWNGLREYYRRYRDGNALTADFGEVMEESSHRDLDWFLDQWLLQPDHPTYVGSWDYDGAASTLSVDLEQSHPGNSLFRVPLEIVIRSQDGSVERLETIEIDDRKETFTFLLDFVPGSVVLDPNLWVLMEGELTRR